MQLLTNVRKKILSNEQKMNSLQYRLVHPPPLKVYQGVKFVKAANTRVWMIASINTIIHTSWWVCFLTSRSADVMYRSGFNVLVHIFHLHNHDVATADCMRHRDVSQETRERIMAMFREGSTPSAAHAALQMKYECSVSASDYTIVSADRSSVPDKSYFHR